MTTAVNITWRIPNPIEGARWQVDYAARVFRSGVIVVPFESVASWWEQDDDDRPTCPECCEHFADARALGAHRKHKHGVSGTARKAPQQEAVA